MATDTASAACAGLEFENYTSAILEAANLGVKFHLEILLWFYLVNRASAVLTLLASMTTIISANSLSLTMRVATFCSICTTWRCLRSGLPYLSFSDVIGISQLNPIA